MAEPASTPKKVAQIAAVIAGLGALPVVYVVGVAIVGSGCLFYLYWHRRDPNQQPAPTSVSVPLGNVQSHPSTSVRRRTGLLSGMSTRRRAGLLSATADYRQGNNANGLGAHTGGRRTADPREVGRNPEPDSFALNAVSQWRTEGERREIQRHFENHEEHGATNETGMGQHPAGSSGIPINFVSHSSPGGNLSELGSPSPANFASPGPRSPPYLFHP